MPNLLVRAGIKVLEFLFAAGIIGAALVVVLTTIEDLTEMFGGNHKEGAAQKNKEASA